MSVPANGANTRWSCLEIGPRSDSFSLICSDYYVAGQEQYKTRLQYAYTINRFFAERAVAASGRPIELSCAAQLEVLLIGALIVTHGNLAHELLKAAQQIEANVRSIEAVPLEWNESVDDSREKIRQALERLPDSQDGVIVFTDMFGGTPSNISLSFLEKGRVEIVTGVNLPMVVKFASMQQEARDVALLAHVISEKGSKAIRVASDLLAAERKAAQG